MSSRQNMDICAQVSNLIRFPYHREFLATMPWSWGKNESRKPEIDFNLKFPISRLMTIFPAGFNNGVLAIFIAR